MEQKESNKEYLNGLYSKLSKIDFQERDRDYLELFSLHISSNPNFKYNQTYLTDTIDVFISALTGMKQKIKTYNQIVKRIRKRIDTEKDVFVVFDEFFEYKINDLISGRFNIVNTDRFRFDKVSRDYCVIRFILKVEGSIEYNEVFRVNLNDKKNTDSLLNDFAITIDNL